MTTSYDVETLLPLSAAVGRPLRWRPDGPLSRAATLVDDEQRAYARMLQFGAFRLAGEFTTSAGQWRLREGGWWRGRIDVLGEATDEPLMSFRSTFLGRGTMVMPDGGTLTWAPENWLGTRHVLRGPDGEPLLRWRVRFFRRDETVLEHDAPEPMRSLAVGVVRMVTVLRHRRRAH